MSQQQKKTSHVETQSSPDETERKTDRRKVKQISVLLLLHILCVRAVTFHSKCEHPFEHGGKVYTQTVLTCLR